MAMARSSKSKQSGEQRAVVGRVMHEFKHGELERRHGGKVKSPKQAIAIALHEAGASNRESPARNRRNLEHTREREAGEGASKAELYAEAKRRDIPGRSRMDKAELRRALTRGKRS
jgi:hypothetical protein